MISTWLPWSLKCSSSLFNINNREYSPRLLRFTSRDCALQCVFSPSVPSTFSATPPLSLTTYVTQRLLGHKDRQTGPGCSWLGGTIYFWFWFFVLGWTHFLHSLKSFPLKPSRCRGCTFESKASAGLQGTGEGEKAGEATISFSSGDYHFYFFFAVSQERAMLYTEQ